MWLCVTCLAVPIIATLGGFTSGERFGCIQGAGCRWGPHFRPLPLLVVAYVAISGDWTSFLVQVSASPLVGLKVKIIIIIIIVSRDTIGMRVGLSAWEDDSNSNK